MTSRRILVLLVLGLGLARSATGQVDFTDVALILENDPGGVRWLWPAGTEGLKDQATEYDLEWVFVDDLATAPPGDPFRYRDPARVTITDERYPLPDYHIDGTLHLRVRPVGRFADGEPAGARRSGRWSGALSLGVTVSDTSGFRTLNWQQTTSFSEGGKRQRAITYFDGALRSRQAQTLLNSRGRALISESKYDHEGRPTLSVLPGPKDYDGTEDDLAFADLFNRAVDGGYYGAPQFNEGAIAPFGAASGAARYYSAENPDQIGHDAYLPDAAGYPFSLTEYTMDASGRRRTQSGIGLPLMLGSGHETKYFYAAAPPGSVLRLFGANAGDSRRYRRDTLKDPNGQTRTTYLDEKQRVVATSLIGASIPEALWPIRRECPASQGGQIPTVDPVLSDARRRSIVYAVAPTEPTLYEFTYTLTGVDYGVRPEEDFAPFLCASCVYSLSMSIKSSSGQLQAFRLTNVTSEIDPSSPIDCQAGSTCSHGPCDWSADLLDILELHCLIQNPNPPACSGDADFESGYSAPDIVFSVTLDGPAEYEIAKSLELVDGEIQATFEELVNRPGLFDPGAYAEAVPHDDTYCSGDCESSCERIINDRYADYEVEGPSAFLLVDAKLVEKLSCVRRCEELRDAILQQHAEQECAMLREQLLADISPGGFHFEDLLWLQGAIDTELCGSGSDLACCSDSDRTGCIRQNWDPEWAASLLEKHREFCHLSFCLSNIASKTFDIEMSSRLVTDPDFDACDYYPLGIPSSTSLAGTEFASDPALIPSAPCPVADPFFQTNASRAQDMRQLLADFAGTARSVWQFVSDPEVHYGSGATATIPDGARWNLFKSVYQGLKQEYIGGVVSGMTPPCQFYDDENARVHHPPTYEDPDAAMDFAYEELERLRDQACPMITGQWILQLAAECGLPEGDPRLEEASVYLEQYCRREFGPENPLILITEEALAGGDPLLARVQEIVGSCISTLAVPDPYTRQEFCLSECCKGPAPDSCVVQVANALVSQLPLQPGQVQASQLEIPGRLLEDCLSRRTSIRVTGETVEIVGIRGESRCRFLFVDGQGTKVAPSDIRPISGPIYDIDAALPVNLPSGFYYTGVMFEASVTRFHMPQSKRTIYVLTDCAGDDQHCDAAPPPMTLCIDSEDLFSRLSSGLDPCFTGEDGPEASTDCLSGRALHERLLAFPPLVRLRRALMAGSGTIGSPPPTAPTCTGVDQGTVHWSGSAPHLEICGTPTAQCDCTEELATGLRELLESGEGAVRLDEGHCYREMRLKDSGIEVRPSTDDPPCIVEMYASATQKINPARVSAVTTVSIGIGGGAAWPDTLGGLHFAGIQLSVRMDDGAELAVMLYTSCPIACGGSPDPGAPSCDTSRRPGNCLQDILDAIHASLESHSPIRQVSRYGGACFTRIGHAEHEGKWLVVDRLEDGGTRRCTLAFVDDKGQIRGINEIVTWIEPPQIRDLPAGMNASISGIGRYTGVAVRAWITYTGREKVNTWLSIYSDCDFPLVDDCHSVVVDVTLPEFPRDCPQEVCEELRDQWVEEEAAEDLESDIDRTDSLFAEVYENRCFSPNTFRETLRYTEHTCEHHYTLFYYDQADNLVQAVPPGGVDELSSDESDVYYDESQTLKPAPDHRMDTRYRHNSLEQVIWQRTPDSGDRKLWYDNAAQLRLSQSAQQRLDGTFFFTKYDARGRTVQAGLVSGVSEAEVLSHVNEESFPGATYTLTDLTSWFYDRLPDAHPCLALNSPYLRGRLAALVRNNGDLGDVVTCYGYDPHGDLETLLQIVPGLDSPKRLDYEYDLASGNVNAAHYQGLPLEDGSMPADQLHHLYEYDADNRMLAVSTSRDGQAYEQDAAYRYYLHGPLSRLELGADKVQGVDYAYTLQGWLKGVNRDSLDLGTTPDVGRDIGKDGAEPAGGGTPDFARDTYGFTLGYFDGDYKSIRESKCSAMTSPPPDCWVPFKVPTRGSAFASSARDLYDATITHSVVANRAFLEQGKGLADGKGVLGTAYRYDQLSRLVAARVHSGITNSTTAWPANAPRDGSYDMTILDSGTTPSVSGYDANGNILTVQRNGVPPSGGGSNAFDDLTYEYGVNDSRLRRIHDQVGTTPYEGDLESQRPNNYVYDADGHLQADFSEGISITWNAYARPAQIEQADGSVINYLYDGNQRRVGVVASAQSATTPDRFLVRDAQGQLIASYEQPVAPGTVAPTSLRIRGATRLGAWQIDGVGALSKRYELGDHLGSILVAVPSHRSPAEVDIRISSAQDHYSYGMEMPRRTAGERAGVGYQGYERADEFKEPGQLYCTDARLYDPRIGRWYSEEPVGSEQLFGVYSFARNNPVSRIDVSGAQSSGADDPLPDPSIAFEKLEPEINEKPQGVTPGMAAVTMPEGYEYRKTSIVGRQPEGNFVLSAAGLAVGAIVSDPSAFFPFEVVGEHGETSLHDNGIFYLVARPGSIPFAPGRNPVRVKLTDTSITFTTLPGHFDPPGSTIRFSTYTDALGNVILEQYARAWAQMDDVPRPLFFNQLAVEGANIAWDIQARQMQKFLSTGRMPAKPLLPRK